MLRALFAILVLGLHANLSRADQLPILPMARKADILVLGVGWTGTFIMDLCKKRGVACVGTTRDGRDGTIKFEFGKDDPASLPDADMAIVTFPLLGAKQVDELYGGYLGSTAERKRRDPSLVLLGSTRAFEGLGATRDEKFMNRTILPERTEAEDELIVKYSGVVLNLAGLHGGERRPKSYMQNVFGPNGERVNQVFSLHLIHGSDIARAVLKMHAEKKLEAGRWIVTDEQVYDQWEIGLWKGWTNEATQAAIRKAMEEQGIAKLPRPRDTLKRWLDSSEFWKRFNLKPKVLLNEDSEDAAL
ncbi:hypothetical protein DFJ74DRAFT_679663 [Hyaloraphidium curvatum]|nr:hypothetical protein DFJ74DRAFT_679663 [Hyaloraphidium curvatum]